MHSALDTGTSGTIHMDLSTPVMETGITHQQREKLALIAQVLDDLSREVKDSTDRQRLNSALAHLRKVGTASKKKIIGTTSRGGAKPMLDQPGSDKIKQAYLIMQAVQEDLSPKHSKHKTLIEHIVGNLRKLCKTHCTLKLNEEPAFQTYSDDLRRAEQAKALLESTPISLLTEKDMGNFDTTKKTIQAFILRITDRSYKPAKVRWRESVNKRFEPYSRSPVRRRRARSYDRYSYDSYDSYDRY